VTTNSPEIALYLTSEKGVWVELLGGRMEMESCETDGSLSEDALLNQYWDMAFMGISALDLAHGITSINRQISSLENLMMTHSRSVVGLCDSSKFNRYAYARAGGIELLDVLVTDSGINDQLRSKISDLDVEVVIAETEIELGKAISE
jgi:DeoR family transcriptional regulator of aga operon